MANSLYLRTSSSTLTIEGSEEKFTGRFTGVFEGLKEQDFEFKLKETSMKRSQSGGSLHKPESSQNEADDEKENSSNRTPRTTKTVDKLEVHK
jgi:hypothetical protein